MPDDQDISGSIATPPASADVPQFSTAEYAHVPGTERCRICGYPITGEYYRVNSQMACAKCAGEARDGQPKDTHAAFLRALVVGAGAAVVGLVIYSTVVIVTGWSIGYLALAVGWLVAKGMMRASNGMGGRRYQVAAVLLTYAAISMSAIPIGISYWMKHPAPAQAQKQNDDSSTSATVTDDSAKLQPAPPGQRPGLSKLLGQLVFLGLASPFLELENPGSGILGLLILFVGLSIAFRMTAARPLEVDGPYPLQA